MFNLEVKIQDKINIHYMFNIYIYVTYMIYNVYFLKNNEYIIFDIPDITYNI